MKVLASHDDLHVIFTHPNADHGRTEIVNHIENFVVAYPHRSIHKDSLGQLMFLSVLKCVDGILGNSSSGIIEAPLINTPTLNIGSRQKGRLRAPTIVDSKNDISSIEQGLLTILNMGFSQPKGLDSKQTPAKTLVKCLVQLGI